MYVGRFAPSPTGPLHLGSLVAALASWLDARAHAGQWLVRIEDVDSARCVGGMGEHILQQLAAFGLISDGPVLWQSQRGRVYQSALDQLHAQGTVYGCKCSRKAMEQHWARRGESGVRHGELRYPGSCRQAALELAQHAVRFKLPAPQNDEVFSQLPIANIDFVAINSEVTWADRRLGPQRQNVASEVGDFVLRRADGVWAYQLAVVVDDAAQGITHVVRGEDLMTNTARQMVLQQALSLPAVAYLHAPLVLASDGQKLSKQNGAQALSLSNPTATLHAALAHLGMELPLSDTSSMLAQATRAWASRFLNDP
jgi:glutamyl-Q tRNA(Asp) synthetase